MTLSFTAIDRHNQFRDFSCQLASLEVALDVLSKITMQGSKILTAYIVDEGKRIQLSSEAFDGVSFSEPIYQLEKQWQEILGEPIRSAETVNDWHIQLTRQRIKILEEKIVQFGLIIARFEEFRQRAEMIYDETRRNKLVRYYDAELIIYRQYVDRAKTGQHIAKKKLRQLQG